MKLLKNTVTLVVFGAAVAAPFVYRRYKDDVENVSMTKLAYIDMDELILAHGVNNQLGGQITISEVEPGALFQGRLLVIDFANLPSGIVLRNRIPKIKINSGDILLGHPKIVSGKVIIPIRSKSSIASSITITDFCFDVIDRNISGKFDVVLGGSALSGTTGDKVVLPSFIKCSGYKSAHHSEDEALQYHNHDVKYIAVSGHKKKDTTVMSSENKVVFLRPNQHFEDVSAKNTNDDINLPDKVSELQDYTEATVKKSNSNKIKSDATIKNNHNLQDNIEVSFIPSANKLQLKVKSDKVITPQGHFKNIKRLVEKYLLKNNEDTILPYTFSKGIPDKKDIIQINKGKDKSIIKTKRITEEIFETIE